MNTLSVPLNAIDAGERLREVDHDWAAVLVESIARQGQMTPIEVRATPGGVRAYVLVAGAHRLRALELLDRAEAICTVFEGGELDARLREIDENLMRHELTVLDRATFLAERKSVYEALYPETKHGDNNRFLPSGQNGHLGVPRYSAEVAERLGLGERTVRRSVKLYQSLHIDARRRLTGTWLADHGQQLDLLASCKGSEQLAALNLLFGPVADGFARPRTVGEALDMVRNVVRSPPHKDEAAFEVFLSLWRKRSPSFRRRVRDFVQKEKI